MVGPTAPVLAFPATTLWYFKASAPIKLKEGANNSSEEVATQTEKDVKLILPIKTTEVCVIGLLSFFLSLQLPFTPSIYRPQTQGLLLFIHPSPLPLPCLITSYSTQILADSPALSPPSPHSAYPPSPLSSVSPSFLVAVSL